MELDEMKALWLELDRRMSVRDAFDLKALREKKVRGIRQLLAPTVGSQVVSGIVMGIAAVLAGSFWFTYRDIPHLLLIGLLLHTYAVLGLASAIGEIVLISRIDYAGPVLAIQGRLAALASWRLREAFWQGIAHCFLWIGVLLALFMVLFHVDLYAHAPRVVLYLVGSGIVTLVLLGAIQHGMAVKSTHPLVVALRQSLIGTRIVRAQTQIAEYAAFADER